MPEEQTLAKAYEPAEVEKKWYAAWEQRGYFHADNTSSKTPYTIVIPPPNVTGQLTMGHILNNTLQDILIRFENSFQYMAFLDFVESTGYPQR